MTMNKTTAANITLSKENSCEVIRERAQLQTRLKQQRTAGNMTLSKSTGVNMSQTTVKQL